MFQETDDKVPTDEITEDSTENESPIRFDRFAQPKPIRQRSIRVALNRENYRSDSTDLLDRNRFDRDHELHRTEILTEITGVMSRDRMSAFECPSSNPEKNTKTF